MTITASPPTKLFMVLYEGDRDCLLIPMVWDVECEGAIRGGLGDTDRVALFPDRKAARKAIDISSKWAALNKAQGKMANDDFLEPGKRNLRVVECRVGEE